MVHPQQKAGVMPDNDTRHAELIKAAMPSEQEQTDMLRKMVKVSEDMRRPIDFANKKRLANG